MLVLRMNSQRVDLACCLILTVFLAVGAVGCGDDSTDAVDAATTLDAATTAWQQACGELACQEGERCVVFYDGQCNLVDQKCVVSSCTSCTEASACETELCASSLQTFICHNSAHCEGGLPADGVTDCSGP